MNTEEKKKDSAVASAGAENKSFRSRYDDEAKAAYSGLKNRKEFSYQPSDDPVYKAHRENYSREGRLAMEDSMGKAADLTGGYGSSYAQSLGMEQYRAYLEKLNDLMPELYAGAYERYVAEGESLKDRLAAASQLADSEYKRYRDMKNSEFEKEKLDYQKKSDAYKNLADAISNSGYIPNEDELASAGMSREMADALSYEFMRVNTLLEEGSEAQAAEIDYYNLHPTSPFDIGYRDGMFDSLLRRKS